jgi:hypothetical protein
VIIVFNDNILLNDEFLLLLSFESFEELLYEVLSRGVDEDELFIFLFLNYYNIYLFLAEYQIFFIACVTCSKCVSTTGRSIIGNFELKFLILLNSLIH